jgi:hypothetical protein
MLACAARVLCLVKLHSRGDIFNRRTKRFEALRCISTTAQPDADDYAACRGERRGADFSVRFALGSVAQALSFYFSSSLAAIFMARGVFSKSVGQSAAHNRFVRPRWRTRNTRMFMTVGSVRGG